MERKEVDEKDDVVCLDGSFFIDDNYQLTTFEFGSQVIALYCLQSASTEFDLTGQLVWPGAMLLNDYLSKNAEILKGCSVIELGSGILKKNIEVHASAEESPSFAELQAEKLEWGDAEQIDAVVQKHPKGMDTMVIAKAGKHGMLIEEVAGTRTMLGYLEGVIFEITVRLYSISPTKSCRRVAFPDIICPHPFIASHERSLSKLVRCSMRATEMSG
ncbi:hypothetical protein AKJ16_DCAP03845 [Drosera capensis]